MKTKIELHCSKSTGDTNLHSIEDPQRDLAYAQSPVALFSRTQEDMKL